MWELHLKGHFTIHDIADRMAHSPAERFRINKRGFIREGYYADLMLFNPNKPYTVSKENIKYKCGWSPFEGTTFNSSIIHTFVNGIHVFDQEKLTGRKAGKRISFSI
jgi:dihydroorotase